MLNKLKKDNQGFTIIEVMIVLAIGGMIILVVLLAVPAVQRNARNTAIKSDASAVAGAISEFSSNNDGAKPVAANSDNVSGTVTINNASGTAATAKIQASTTWFDGDGAPGAAITPVAGELRVYFGAKCPVTVTGASVLPTTNTRGTAIVYGVETSGGVQAKCLDT